MIKPLLSKSEAKGAYLHTKEERVYIEGFPVQQVVDPVGAGDGFAAGIISGILKQEPIHQAIKRANAIGAMVVNV